ncbi:MAG TPA: alpha/beta hydrolase [Solirubrobacteraceae bacterium]|nr:alpha/beta hydrolase [Solirubrobacteraceae bacterium]
MDPEIARRVAAIGDIVGPDQAAASREIFAPLHETSPHAGVEIFRDARYGPHERHRLDVFSPAGARDLPVVVFVHGGGFVAGDKSTAGTPYYDNVGLWGARSGMVGVTMNYRLAPEHRWPSGAEDVAAAVAWLAANVGAHGGDPSRIVLMGSSAGATHVAGYGGMAGPDPGVRGVVLLSGAYDLPLFDDTSILAPVLRPRLGGPGCRLAARRPRRLGAADTLRRRRARPAGVPPPGRGVVRRPLRARRPRAADGVPTRAQPLHRGPAPQRGRRRAGPPDPRVRRAARPGALGRVRLVVLGELLVVLAQRVLDLVEAVFLFVARLRLGALPLALHRLACAAQRLLRVGLTAAAL